jgi:hypothetical protein
MSGVVAVPQITRDGVMQPRGPEEAEASPTRSNNSSGR